MMKTRCQRGAALLEMGLLLPVLLLTLLGASDFGRLSYVAVLLGSAANAGARFATLTITNADDTDGIKNAVTDDLGSTSVGRNFGITVQKFCTCAPNDTSIACGNICPVVSGYSSAPRVFININVQSTFDTLFSYPGIPKSVLVTRQAQMRVE